MSTKFNKGDLVKIRTSGETVMVLSYKINYTGGIVNALTRQNNYANEVITDEILCEGTIDKKFQRRYINEANLELITAAPVQ